MDIKRILCPIDYSFYSKAANYYASLFAKSSGALIFYLNVNWPPTIQSTEDRLADLSLKLKTEIRPYVHGVRHRYVVRDGHPAREILSVADDLSIDLIVMGTHGATGLERLLHGSVCGKVLRKSKCPVMTVKDALNVDWIMHQAAQPPLQQPLQP